MSCMVSGQKVYSQKVPKSKGLQIKRSPSQRSTNQKVPKSKGLQVKRSPSQKVYKSKGPQSKGLQKFESIKESYRSKTFIIYSFIIICDMIMS